MSKHSGQSIYALEAINPAGKAIPLSNYAGKVMLIVNTASKCGHTYQLEMLESLYQEFKDKGLVIIGFPSDQFAQEPLNNEQIESHCQVNYGVTFPIMGKSKVRGDEANPVFKFFADKSRNGAFSNKPKWNFYKYLVGRDGKVIDYFWTYRKPDNSKIRKAIERALQTPVAN